MFDSNQIPGEWRDSTDSPVAAFSTPDQTERNSPYFVSEDESLLTGVWECAPSILEFDSYPVHELMTVLSGTVTITDHDNDRSETFVTGDSCFVAMGSRFTWEITETLRKCYFVVT